MSDVSYLVMCPLPFRVTNYFSFSTIFIPLHIYIYLSLSLVLSHTLFLYLYLFLSHSFSLNCSFCLSSSPVLPNITLLASLTLYLSPKNMCLNNCMLLSLKRWNRFCYFSLLFLFLCLSHFPPNLKGSFIPATYLCELERFTRHAESLIMNEKKNNGSKINSSASRYLKRL